ncbi:ClpXP protease specificity-enhancing factor [Halomonas elongata]|uniref:ClpXP protease specificity-enhancing factor n=2 Tax=Halomonas elongata TaxID=2746 RepID=E1V9J7_HALED|nr:ClpXP protease specificity-enhancing factor [Halomonas elongata]MBW5798539.1 ClpXP protease specificity-enhancing factor [Halomonas elongata]MDL4862449.1 ClpXP protease specificity-enhancing factor [Halomonas elongata]OBX37244.1 stringent starvation protein B [Halomonas elongata]WBF19076.1 ClpXP protease specificity-enhancing factor [Halomonas elongata]WPU47935.1 ClpXP protease specificity-enhancing factor [Halomonas elongata DSM 2581]
MHSSRPYIARALYQWLLDNELTPYIVVDAEQEGVEVPRQFVQNGQIVLNMGVSAIRDLSMENEAISFSARFGGKPTQLMVPMEALIAIYARENGVGMVFGHEPVMPDVGHDESEAETGQDEAKGPTLASVDETEESEASSSEREGETPRKGRPSLRVVK